MEWIKIDKNDLPKGEVLAANFQHGKFGYKEKLLGYLSKRSDVSDERVICEDEYQILENCTHYIDIHKFDVE